MQQAAPVTIGAQNATVRTLDRSYLPSRFQPTHSGQHR